uniref:Acyl-CoA dehydrogenase n=1 Tax=Bursaphelenchus xylophilus TaxID=6326 RepID=A0A1I7S171_BURXY
MSSGVAEWALAPIVEAAKRGGASTLGVSQLQGLVGGDVHDRSNFGHPVRMKVALLEVNCAGKMEMEI